MEIARPNVQSLFPNQHISNPTHVRASRSRKSSSAIFLPTTMIRFDLFPFPSSSTAACWSWVSEQHQGGKSLSAPAAAACIRSTLGLNFGKFSSLCYIRSVVRNGCSLRSVPGGFSIKWSEGIYCVLGYSECVKFGWNSEGLDWRWIICISRKTSSGEKVPWYVVDVLTIVVQSLTSSRERGGWKTRSPWEGPLLLLLLLCCCSTRLRLLGHGSCGFCCCRFERTCPLTKQR